MQQALISLRNFISISPAHATTVSAPSSIHIAEKLYAEMIAAFSLAQSDENRIANVQLCQRALHRLLQLPHTQNDPAQFRHIESLVLEIKDQFPGYFNWDEQLPPGSACLSPSIKKLQQVIKKTPPLSTLFSILLHYIKNGDCTWRALDCINHFLSHNTVAHADPLIIAVQYNFNLPEVKDYIVSLYQPPGDVQSNAHFKHILTQLSHITVRSPHPIIGSYPSLKDQLMCWSNDQWFCSPQVAGTSQAVKQEDFKLTTTLSVAQLAALTRLLIEAGIIRCSNTTQFLSIIAQCVSTPSSGSISPLSFRNKFYNIERNTFMSMKDICINLLNITRKLSG